MDRNSSFSLTQTLPIAESTCLNTSRKSNNFQWGGLAYGSAGERSIARSTDNSETISRRANGNFGNGLNRSRIDPSVYADVQSKGLASRIVKYHEKRTRLNRSLSANSFYRPGEFPIVQLKKVELPSRVQKKSLTMTRIAPPVRSLYYGNSLAGITRCNSDLTLHRNEEDLSSENRPIMHPPTVDNEPTPTRSVLDVLKEISRKRINTDDLDCNDSIKKYCNESALHEQRNVANAFNQSLSYATVNQKRPREQYGSSAQLYPPIMTPELNKTSRQGAVQQLSPEQSAKRRNCSSLCNEFKSSLSSSQFLNNKRKQNAAPLTQNAGKIARACIETSQIEQITKLDETAKTSATVSTHSESAKQLSQPDMPVQPKRSVTAAAVTTNATTATNKPKLTLFNKTCNENEDLVSSNATEAADGGRFGKIAFITPKRSITVSAEKNAMKQRTQKSKLALMLSGLSGELYSEGEEEDEENTETATKALDNNNAENKNINKDDSANVVASAATHGGFKLTETKTTKTASLTTISSTMTTSISPIMTSTITAAVSKPSTSSAAPLLFTGPAGSTKAPSSLNFGGFAASTAAATATTTSLETPKSSAETKITSPLVGIKLQPAANVSFGSFASAAQTTQTATITNSVANATASATQTSANSLSTIFGKPAALAQPMPAATAAGFSFGSNSLATTTQPTSASNTVTTFTSNAPATTAGGFSFGSSSLTATTQQPSVPNTVVTFASNAPATATGGFSFGSSSLTATTQPASASKTVTTFTSNAPATATGGFSFGSSSFAATTQPASTPATTATSAAAKPLASTSTFAGFGLTGATNISFGSGNTGFANSSASSFGAASTPSTAAAAAVSNTSATFTFGASTFAAKAAENNKNSSSTSASSAAAQGPFSFAGSATNATSTSFAGLSAAATAANNADNNTASYTFRLPSANKTSTAGVDTTDKTGSTKSAANTATSGLNQSTFGAGNNQQGNSSMFNFGSTFGKPTSTQPSTAAAANTNVFAAATATVASNAGGFQFNAPKPSATAQPNNSSASSSIFGNLSANTNKTSATALTAHSSASSQPAAAASAPSFGAENKPAPFTFGASPAASASFTFGATAQQNQATSSNNANLFASPSSSTNNQAAAKPAFNFAASVPATGNTAAVSPNLFAPPAAASSSLVDRPIRRAHRRLQKPI